MRKDRDHPESLSRMRLAYVQAMSRLRSEYVDTPAGYHDEEARSADQSRIEEAEQECFFMEGGVIRTPDIPADTFVGRNRELGEIHSRMRQGHRIILISGMGGIGKTALAGAYAARTEGAQDGYDAVLWRRTAAGCHGRRCPVGLRDELFTEKIPLCEEIFPCKARGPCAHDE